MSRKTSPARVAAFFRALGETGNRTIAAERARVSQSWVSLHRSTDPGFAARMTAAVDAARARLRAQAKGVVPPTGWRSIDGEELVVRGTNGRRVQIARARLRQWTPRVEARFLSALAACCNVKAACTAVGLSQASAYNHYRRWPEFARRWETALENGYARIEAAVVEAAGSPFCGGDIAPDLAIGPASFAEALQLLRLHRARVRGVGRRPGSWGKPPDPDAIRDSILKKIDAIERARARENVDPAADRREIARGVRVVAGKRSPGD